jgi:hypothetical protein
MHTLEIEPKYLDPILLTGEGKNIPVSALGHEREPEAGTEPQRGPNLPYACVHLILQDSTGFRLLRSNGPDIMHTLINLHNP